MPDNDSLPTASPTPPPSEQEPTTDELLGDVELHTPIRINEVLYDISSNFNAAILDLTDGVVQVKSVTTSLLNDELWQDEDFKQAAALSSMGSIDDFCNDTGLGNDTTYSDYLDSVSTNVYNNYESFTEYAYTLEYVIALIETELLNSCPEDYDAILNSIKDKTNVNELGHLDEDLAAGKIAGVARDRALVFVGAAMKPAGSAVWQAFKNGGIQAVIQLPHGQMLVDAFNNFMSGEYILENGKVPAFGSRLLSGLGAAAIFFVLGVGQDAITGNFSWENVAVRGAKALVGVGASLAGTAVTSALTGTAAGSWAGPIGMAVGAVVAVIGNVVVDAINHHIHYTSNELPRDYTPITLDNVREQMEKSGYATGIAKVGDESYYDVVSSLLCSTDNEEFISYLIQKSSGDTIMTPPTEIPGDQMYRYDDMIRYLESNPRASNDDISFIFGYLNEKEISFIDTYRETIGDNPARFDVYRDYLGDEWFSHAYGRQHPARMFQAIPPEVKDSMGPPLDQPQPPTPEPTPQAYYDSNGFPLSETPPPPTTPIPPGA